MVCQHICRINYHFHVCKYFLFLRFNFAHNNYQQSLIMTSLSDNLDPTGGKVIRIVSLDEDGHYLSLSDGAQMQILNQDLGMSSDALSASDSVLAMQGVRIGLERYFF